MPSTKHIESRILDFPLPFKPVIALNDGSKSRIIVRLPYDLKPSIDRVFMNILSNHIKTTTQPAIQIKKYSCCCFSTHFRAFCCGWLDHGQGVVLCWWDREQSRELYAPWLFMYRKPSKFQVPIPLLFDVIWVI